MNTAWINGRQPEQWEKQILYPIYYNMGGKGVCGLCFSQICTVYERILKKKTNKKIGEWQYEHITCTTGMVYRTQQIIEKTWKCNIYY